jgi:hypothetical protein
MLKERAWSQVRHEGMDNYKNIAKSQILKECVEVRKKQRTKFENQKEENRQKIMDGVPRLLSSTQIILRYGIRMTGACLFAIDHQHGLIHRKSYTKSAWADIILVQARGGCNISCPGKIIFV